MSENMITDDERRSRRIRMQQRKKNMIYSYVGILLLCCILIFIFLSFIQKDKSYSEKENRMLAQRPGFSFLDVRNGKFMTDMEEYVVDQFPLRDSWITLKCKVNELLGFRENNGVYLGKEDHLLEIPDQGKEKKYAKTAAAIKEFAEDYPDIHTVMTLVPNAAAITDQYLPDHAPVTDQSQIIKRVGSSLGSNVDFVDLTSVLKEHKTEEIYYKTDHHWTSLGAKYGFEGLSDALGLTDTGDAEYNVYAVSGSFFGTLSSKSGSYVSADRIDIYANTVNPDYVVEYVDEGIKTASVYDSASLDQKDQYEVFFGGNHSRIDITTENQEKDAILILKDSYANCFIQFLLPYYSKIIMIDPRYYYDDLDQLILSNNISDVLILYNVNTFISDRSLTDVF